MVIAGFDITAIRESIRMMEVLKSKKKYRRDEEAHGDELTAAAKAVYMRLAQLASLEAFVDAGVRICEEAIKDAEIIAETAVIARNSPKRGMTER